MQYTRVNFRFYSTLVWIALVDIEPMEVVLVKGGLK